MQYMYCVIYLLSLCRMVAMWNKTGSELLSIVEYAQLLATCHHFGPSRAFTEKCEHLSKTRMLTVKYVVSSFLFK